MAAVEQPHWSAWVEVGEIRRGRDARLDTLRLEHEALTYQRDLAAASDRGRRLDEAREAHVDPTSGTLDLRRLVAAFEQTAEDWAMAAHGGNVAAAARALGMARTTLAMRLQARKKEGQ